VTNIRSRSAHGGAASTAFLARGARACLCRGMGRSSQVPMPRCPIHPSITLICPACIGSKGGKVMTPKKLRSIRRVAKARRHVKR